MPIFKTGLSRGKHCRNVSYHRLNKHIPLAAVNYFICLPAWDTLPNSAQDKVSLSVPSQGPAVSPHSGSQAEGTTALRS